MFCFQTPFGRRERDKTLPNNYLSESESNLNALNYNATCLCHSDSHIPGSCSTSRSKKRERWRANAQIGYQMALLLKSKGKCEKGNAVEAGSERDLTARGKSTGDLCDLLKERAIPVESQRNLAQDIPPYSQSLFQTIDMEFIDESETASEETVGEKKVCRTGINGWENSKSEYSCLINRKSITDPKAINNNSIRPPVARVGETHGKDVSVRLESRETDGELGDTQIILHVNSDLDVSCKSDSSNGTNALKCGNKSLKQAQKINSGTSFLSFFSLFNLSKSPAESSDKIYSRNNEAGFRERDAPVVIQQNIVTASLSCCPLSSQRVDHVPVDAAERETSHPGSNVVIINKSPKPKNKTLFPKIESVPHSHSVESNGSFFCSDSSSSGDTSSDGVAPMASPEVISSAESALSSPRLSEHSTGDVFQGPCHGSKLVKRSFHDSNSSNPFSMGYAVSQSRSKLLHEGDIQVCYLNHTRTIFSKVLTSKFLRRWETHHIYLTDDSICSRTPTGFLESPVPYSSVDEVYSVGRWDQGNRFCIRLVTGEGSLLLQTSNSLVSDQWLSSILWKKNMQKYRNILQNSTRPEVVLKEIKGLVYSSLNSSLQDDCITHVPIDIISRVLDQEGIWNDRQRTEEVIVALAPLLEDSTPSPEMFRFFSRHCLSHPRSPVIVDVFTSIVHRILKRTVDFGKSPLMRRFVADYFKALHSQNNGDEAIRKFVLSIHGTSCGCPHPRVLPNLVAVNLAAVFSHFEERKTLLAESANEANCNEAMQHLDKQLECVITLFLTISEFEDWRPGLAQLLQPIPFPDDALYHDAFVKGFIPVIRKIGVDPRCDVHEMVLGIRENKEGWLNVFCPSSLVCKDEGVLWCQMLNTLFYCCCRRKSFLQKMVKHLGALLLVGLRGHGVAQEMLCLMLEWRLLPGEDQEQQVVTTLQSTESGRQKYSELCKRQEHLRELQKEGGPKKLTLPSRSTDADVARLLSCGSFGNLECLSLAFTHVTSACAHQLIQLPALRYLNLWATQFGDAGLVIIAEHLDKLQVLNLCETPVSDKGIAAIAAMRSLKKLNLNSTKLSPQTLDTLKQKLPTLQELDVRYTDAW